MRQHAGCVGGSFPVAVFQQFDQPPVPFFCLNNGAAPVVICDVKNVVPKVFELLIRCFGSVEVKLYVANKQVPPFVRVLAFEEPQTIHRQLVMGAGALLSEQYSE